MLPTTYMLCLAVLSSRIGPGLSMQLPIWKQEGLLLDTMGATLH